MMLTVIVQLIFAISYQAKLVQKDMSLNFLQEPIDGTNDDQFIDMPSKEIY